MAIPDISQLIQIAPTMMRDLPQMLSGLQVIFYIVLILVFGSIIIKGYRGYMHFALRLLLRLGFGFVALVCGLGLSGIIPMFSADAFYTMIQSIIINPFIGIVISTAVLMVSLYLISHNIFNIPGIKKHIAKLQEKLKKAEEVTSKTVKRKLEPIRIVGIVILIVFLVFSLLNFQGFPSLSEDLFSFIGITPEEVEELGEYIEGMGIGKEIPEDCVPILTLIDDNYDDFLNDRLPESTDPGIKSMIESNSGLTIAKVYQVTYDQRNFFLGVAEDNICSATATEFCECLDLKYVM